MRITEMMVDDTIRNTVFIKLNRVNDSMKTAVRCKNTVNTVKRIKDPADVYIPEQIHRKSPYRKETNDGSSKSCNDGGGSGIMPGVFRKYQ